MAKRDGARRVIEGWRLLERGGLPWEPARRRPDGSETVVAGVDATHGAFTLNSLPGPAVAVIALGHFRRFQEIEERWGAADITRDYPPVLIEVRGRRTTFLPAWGSWLLGYAWCGPEVVLLGHDGALLLFLRGDGERFRLVRCVKPDDLPRVVNLDDEGPRSSAGERTRRLPTVPRPPASTPADVLEDHRRILDHEGATAEDRERASRVFILGIAEIERRGRAAARNAEELRAVADLRPILEVLRDADIDLRMNGEAAWEYLRRIDEGRISRRPRVFVTAIRLIARVAPFVVCRLGREDWYLRGHGLGDPMGRVHATLCRLVETGEGRATRARPGRGRASGSTAERSSAASPSEVDPTDPEEVKGIAEEPLADAGQVLQRDEAVEALTVGLARLCVRARVGEALEPGEYTDDQGVGDSQRRDASVSPSIAEDAPKTSLESSLTAPSRDSAVVPVDVASTHRPEAEPPSVASQRPAAARMRTLLPSDPRVVAPDARPTPTSPIEVGVKERRPSEPALHPLQHGHRPLPAPSTDADHARRLSPPLGPRGPPPTPQTSSSSTSPQR